MAEGVVGVVVDVIVVRRVMRVMIARCSISHTPRLGMVKAQIYTTSRLRRSRKILKSSHASHRIA